MIIVHINGEGVAFPTRESALIGIIKQYPGADFRIIDDAVEVRTEGVFYFISIEEHS